MFKNVKQLTEKKNDLITRAETIVNNAEIEKRELTDAEAQELAEIRDDVKRIKEILEITDDIDGARSDEKPAAAAAPAADEKPAEDEKALQETRAFENYIRGRVIHERAGEMAFTDNGAIVPETIANRIIKKVYDISPILQRSMRYNVKGTLQIPYYDVATSRITVAYATEFTPLTSSTGKFLNITLTGFLAGALTKISNSLINNAAFDVVSYVVEQMAEDIARFIEGELLNGTEDKVAGLSTLTNGITAAAAAAITSDEVIALKDSVKDVFQANAIWIMSPATRTALRLLKDDVGRYLLQDDITSPFGSVLLGKPVYCSDNMPDMAAGKKAIFYGDFKGLATKFSEDVKIQVLRERFADEHATGVVGWFEFDAKVQDAQALAALTMAAQ